MQKYLTPETSRRGLGRYFRAFLVPRYRGYCDCFCCLSSVALRCSSFALFCDSRVVHISFLCHRTFFVRADRRKTSKLSINYRQISVEDIRAALSSFNVQQTVVKKKKRRRRKFLALPSQSQESYFQSNKDMATSMLLDMYECVWVCVCMFRRVANIFKNI